MRLAHALAILAVAASLSAAAAVPDKMSYQGYLTSAGVPVNATVSMTVKLYDAPTGGNLVWSESQSVPVANGVYNVILGNTTPLTKTVLNGPRYLTVAVGADADMTPRTPLASAPYAILAKELDGTLGSPGVGQVLTGTAGGAPQWSNNTGGAPLTIAHPAWVVLQGVTFNNGNLEMGAGNTLSIGGLQVVGARQTGIPGAANATGVDVAAAGPYMVVTVAEFNSLVARVNQLRVRLENHGLIEPGAGGPIGSACSNAVDCLSNICITGTCQGISNNSPCVYPDQCISNLCGDPVGNMICQGRPSGQQCTAGNQCASTICNGSICQ